MALIHHALSRVHVKNVNVEKMPPFSFVADITFVTSSWCWRDALVHSAVDSAGVTLVDV